MKDQFSRFFGIASDKASVEEIRQLSVNKIIANKYQPRSIFDDEKIEELAQTIKTHGVIQPIVVREAGDEKYEIIAGERRWRACVKLGMKEVPAIIRNLNDTQSASVALIENLQREGLTSIEEAYAYQSLIELHNLTQESLAQRLGKGQSTIANKLRLLHLPVECHQALKKRTISERHARALLVLKKEELQRAFLEEIIKNDWNVKQTELKVEQYLEKKEEQPKKKIRRAFSRDMRIAMNTIRQSIEMISKSGIQVETDEKDSEQYYEIIIKLPK